MSGGDWQGKERFVLEWMRERKRVRGVSTAETVSGIEEIFVGLGF